MSLNSRVSGCPTAHYSSIEFFDCPVPELGSTSELLSGIYWIKMSLPFSPREINLWLLRDNTSWAQVDAGIANRETREAWEQIEKNILSNSDVKQLIITHMHPDHVGLAGWLAQRWNVPLSMSGLEYLMARNLLVDSTKPVSESVLAHYHKAGFDASALAHYKKNFGSFARGIVALPDSYQRLVHGDCIMIDGYCWEVVIGRGHTSEQVCLFSKSHNVFIAGDQLLPGISSNVSVWPVEPRANPLQEWLDSCRFLINYLPEDVLVLPSHGRPFKGAHVRLQQLIDGHEKALDRLHGFCKVPRRAVDIFPILFKRPIDLQRLVLATGESLAHLNYLVAQGSMHITTDAKGVAYYTSEG